MTVTGAGQLRERVTIQSATMVANDSGGQTVTWGDVATVYARVEQLSGSKVLQAMALQTPHTHRVTIRHRSDVTPANRLVWRDEPLLVRAIRNPDERRFFLEIDAERGVAT